MIDSITFQFYIVVFLCIKNSEGSYPREMMVVNLMVVFGL